MYYWIYLSIYYLSSFSAEAPDTADAFAISLGIAFAFGGGPGGGGGGPSSLIVGFGAGRVGFGRSLGIAFDGGGPGGGPGGIHRVDGGTAEASTGERVPDEAAARVPDEAAAAPASPTPGFMPAQKEPHRLK